MNANPSYQLDGPVYDNSYELQNQPVENTNDRTRSIVSVQKSVNRKLSCLQFALVIVSIVAVISLLIALAAVIMTALTLSGETNILSGTPRPTQSPNSNASGESLVRSVLLTPILS